MPDIDGNRVVRTIKAESPKTPVIMMTGCGTCMKNDGETLCPWTPWSANRRVCGN